jgi:hypothetical protein
MALLAPFTTRCGVSVWKPLGIGLTWLLIIFLSWFGFVGPGSLACISDFHHLGIALGRVVHFKDMLVVTEDAVNLLARLVLLPVIAQA